MTALALDCETPDIHSSSAEYAKRFSGGIGEWMLQVQSEALRPLLNAGVWRTVLDVGGGHGQVLPVAINSGMQVAVTGSSEVCRERIESWIARGADFHVAPLLRLPFPDRSFDVVTCFRQLSHCQSWQALVVELCRVSRHAVIVDYPPLFSWNILSPLLFRLKRRIEGNTRPFSVFSDSQIHAAFARTGFNPDARAAQFALPMGLHRGLGWLAASQSAELVCRVAGITKMFGSPVIVRMRRGDESA